jgi:aminoglycoside 3-N-acetyltransferase I
MKVDIKILTEADLYELKDMISVFQDVFEMKNFVLPDTAHLQNLLAQVSFLAVIAKYENKVIGGLTVYTLNQYYSVKPLAYIYDLVVMTEFQRKGVGKQLIEFITDYCKRKGFEEVFVQADRIDAYALDFYRETNPTNEEDVVHFYYSL